jgi:hypothetical protein
MYSRGPPETFGSGDGRFHSPGSLRHKFFRENYENQRSPDDRYMAHGASPLSPHGGFGARYESCDPQSPRSDRSPDHFTRHARVFNSPNTRRGRTEDHIGAPTPERTRGSAVTIDFDGLRDVPVGPRLDIGKIEAKKFRPPDIHTPYILIPSEHVPPLPRLTRHLHAMLKAQRPQGIIANDQGWHLYYDNSTNGRLKLKRCYHEFHRKKFFNYELNMQCFLNGSGRDNQYQQPARTSLESNGNISNPSSPRVSVKSSPQINRFAGLETRTGLESNGRTGDPSPPRVSAKSSPQISRFAGREIAYPDPLRKNEATNSRASLQSGDNDALKDTPSYTLQQNLPRLLPAEVYAQSASPVNANISMLSQRSERDDTASQASGMTRSDSSRIKRDKCHVCSGETGHGLSSLVKCSTCRRKYHRRCHQDPVIPDGLGDDHTWSCRSCVKKGRKHKGKQQGKIVVKSVSKVPTEISPLPASLVTDGEKRSGTSDAPAPQHIEAEARPDAQVSVARPGSRKPQLLSKRHVTTKPDAEVALEISNGDLTLSDPDDLVEKSFSAAANVSQTQPQCQKPGKFKMTRTKLPPPVPVLKAQQPKSEEQASQTESSKDPKHAQAAAKHNIKDNNTNKPVARNSAADLRALAHKAYEAQQSTIRNGTRIGIEGHVESGGRQSRDIHSASTTKHSSVEQPTVQSEARHIPEHAQCDPVVSTAPTRMSQLEIPESPDEVRLGSMSRVDAAQDPRLLAKHTRVSSGLSAEQVSDASPVQFRKHTASKKSKGLLFSCCSACQKRIPAGPSGMARLCLGCKQKVTARGSSQTVDANPGTETTAQVTAAIVTPAEEQRVTPHNDQEHVGSIARSGAGGEKEQSAAALQPNGNTDQASPAPPSTTKAQPTGVCEEDTAIHTVDKDGDISMVTTLPTDEAATTRLGANVNASLAGRLHVLGSAADPPVDGTTKLRDHSMHDADEAHIEITSPGRIEYIRSIVGDSHNRPKGSRTILVAMAMSMFPNQRMQAKDILDWIVANIPTCKASEGNWRERVVSQLTQGTRAKGVAGYWLMDEWKEGDGGVPGKKWYKLLPERADEMWTWCPLRQRPVEPKRPSIPKTSSLKRRRESKSTDTAAALRETLSVSSVSTPTTSLVTRPSTMIDSTNGLGSSKQSSTAIARTPDRRAMDVDGSLSTQAARVKDERPKDSGAARSKEPRATPVTEHASSDDEPLLKRLRREEAVKPRLPRLEVMQQHTPANTEMEELPDAENEATHETAMEYQGSPDLERSTEASNPLMRSKKAKVVVLNMRKSSLSDGINKLPVQNQLVASLYKEWPEYRAENMLDEEAKLAEIVKRPTRKQMFGKPALCSRLRVREPSVEVPAIPVNVSPEKRTRLFIHPDNLYPWEKDASSTFEEFKSLDEFFDFPTNVIPIISEGQLAYRDGTRNDDGRLPRAREVFKP